MEIFIVLLSLSAVVLASLEPTGYRLPTPTPSQYLPPQHDDRNQQQRIPGPTPPQYLSPSTPRSSTDGIPSPSPYFYLPPQNRLPEPTYLPAVKSSPSAIPSPPSNDYLPPLAPVSSVSPSTEYLPPRSRPQPTLAPTTEYLPPSRGPTPPSNYLPPVPASRIPPTTDFLTREPSLITTGYPLPGSSRSPSFGTPVTKGVKVAPVSPYQPLSPAYSPRTRPPSITTTALTSSVVPTLPTTATIKGSVVGPSQTKGFLPRGNTKSLEQPLDNYLPAHDSDLDGFNYSSESDSASYEDQLTEDPSKYDFEYRVSDEFGNDYTHRETRAGSQTQGFYSVLLPDGRRQIVHYQADESGFKPRISYEEAATVLGPRTPEVAGYDAPANSLDAHGPY